MKTNIPIEELLRWRLAQAEAEAPRAPRAAHLLELARPWWEKWPEQFQSVVERLCKIQIAYGHAMVEPQKARSGHPVPAVIVRAVEQLETSASILYFHIRDGRLHLRFELAAAHRQAEPCFDLTFVSDPKGSALFSGRATRSVDNEYRVDVELADELAEAWKHLKVTDRMPFRLILRPDTNG